MRKFYSLLVLIFSFLASNAQTVVINTGTAGTPAYNAGPIYRSSAGSGFDASRYAYLYTESELAAAGILPGSFITELGWTKSNSTTTTGGGIFRIYLKQSTATAFSNATETWANLNNGATLVYENLNQTIPATVAPDYITFTFSTPYLYSGGSLEISTEWDITGVSGSPTTGTFNWLWSTVSDRIYGHGDTELSFAGTLSSTSNSISTINDRRPFIQITYMPAAACVGTPVPGSINGNNIICSNQSTTLTVSGQTSATGLTYQWLSSTGGGPFTPIAGATETSYTTPALTANTSFAVQVMCGANSATTAPFNVTVTPGLPAGTYTINGTQATGGTNYQTFADAMTALGCGIQGPIVFNVTAGFYDEQVAIPEILGSSATNTVVFNGNGATIRQSPTSSARHLIQLNGSDYVTINGFNLLVLSNTDNVGWGIHLTNGADNNIITGNNIDITSVTSTSQSNSAGIVLSGSNTSVLTGTMGDNNNINNNTITGAYQGIIITGDATPQDAAGNIINNNIISDFYARGVDLAVTDGTIVSNNNISRANRAIVTTFTGIELGGENINAVISGNRIHNTHDIANSQSGTAYGININGNDAPAGSENLVFNNLIYNFNSEEGDQYGLYNSSSDGVKFYHNTVVFDNASSTEGLTRGMYQTTSATNIEFRNNLVYITRGGTEEKQGIMLNTTASTVVVNNNVYYINATNSFVGSYGTNDYVTLTNWQTANSAAYDQNSMEADPLFADPANALFYPNNSAFGSLGFDAGITTDILGTSRDASPTPGAYEIVAAVGVDLGAFELALPLQKNCYSATETVGVTIRNFSASTHNFVTTPVTVTVAVTGPNATTFTSVVINTGTLAPDATLNVVISSAYDMTAPGTYTFTASTTATGDANALNDAMQAQDIIVKPLEAGTLSSDPPNYCVTGGIPELSISGSSGGTIQWQESSSGLPGSWINVGTTDSTYAPAVAITSTTYYRAYITCGSNGDTTNVVEVNVFAPQLLTTTPGTRCGPGTVILNATASPGYTLNWYTAASGGTPIFTGPAFTTPIINTNTTYYVAASSGGITANIGAPDVDISTSRSSQTSENTVGIEFDVLASNLVISSVDIYSTAAVGTSFTIQVRQGTTVIAEYTGTTTVQGSTTAPVAQTVPVGFSVPVGTGYTMVFSNNPGTIRNDGGDVFPYELPNVITLTSSTLGGFYYYFYNWQVSTGCETTRTAVTATITPAPAFDVTNSTTICNDAIIPLQVNSSLASFNNYTWAPVTGLYTDPNATVPYTGGSATIVFAKLSTEGTFTYVATANNTTTNCQNIDSLHLTVLPAAITASASPNLVCISGPVTLSYSPNEGFGAATAQWFSSSDGVNFNIINNATGITFATQPLTSTTTFKVEIKDAAGNVCQAPTITIPVNTPQLVTSNSATRCGPGTVDLTATAGAGSTIRWYAAATGGAPLATGPTFTTPSLSATTSFYVAAASGESTFNIGAPNTGISPDISSQTSTTSGINFDVHSSSLVINSVDIYPTATVGEPFTIEVVQGTTVIATYSGVTTVQGSATSPVVQTVPVNFSIPQGTGYRIRFDDSPGALRNDDGDDFPYAMPGAITLTSSTGTGFYYYFYNWSVSSSCETTRAEVTATVSPNTGITTQPTSQAVCTGANISFSVTAVGADLTYQWKKDNVDIAGATSATLTLNAVTPTDNGSYTVVITGLCGTVTSDAAALAVANNNSWLGAVSNDWNTPANWCGGVPTETSDIVINSGTPYQPVVNGIGNVRNISVANGASLTIAASAFLNIHGDFSNGGTFTAPSGFVAFKGAANQTIGAMTVGNVIMNGTGGVTLAGDMEIGNNLVLTSGNITLGSSNLVLNNSASGTAASHIVTNGTGVVTTNNVNASAVTVPVGPNATSYNPVIISNGQGRNYDVRVSTGINPTINNPNRAINRTWYVMPNTTPSSPVNLVFQFVDGDMNSSASATLVMEAGVNNGSGWTVVSPANGVTPSGTPTDRQVGVSTTIFGSFVIGNFGAISFPTATSNIDADITSIQMMPNVVRDHSVLRVHTRRAMKIHWNVVDASGRIVMTFTKEAFAGQNDIQLHLGKLAQGAYQIVGSTEKGRTGVVRFIKM